MGKRRKPENLFTTMRVSKDFLDKVLEKRITESPEDTLRRLLGWDSLEKKGVNIPDSK